MIPMTKSLYATVIKRPLDAIVGLLLLVLTAPIHFVCALWVKFHDGGPVYFVQERVGQDGELFPLYKLRTMRVNTQEKYGGYPVASMVTKPGRLLRRLSLDELPQLWNIARGDMSLVGPRPALAEQVCRYTQQQRQRLTVRPGLTGAAQVKYRNSATWSKRIEEDIRYVKNISFLNDFLILLNTIPATLAGEGQTVGQQASEVDDLGQGSR